MTENVKESVKVTTIKVSLEVREQLKGFGLKGESYDVVLRRILRALPKKTKKELMEEILKGFMEKDVHA